MQFKSIPVFVVGALLISVTPSLASDNFDSERPVSENASSALGPAPEGFANWHDFWGAQDSLVNKATAIRDRAEREKKSKFSGITINIKEKAIDLYLKGAPGKQVLRAIARAEKSAQVHVHHARYDSKELGTTARRLSLGGVHLADGTEVPKGSTVIAKDDGSGIDVELHSATPTLKSATSNKFDLRTTFEGVPTHVSNNAQTRLHYTNASRLAEPHLAGGFFTNSSGGACTSGFAVKINTGDLRMLTAAHCAASGASVFSNTGADIGTISNWKSEGDVALIKFSSSYTPQSLVHWGSWYGSSTNNGDTVDTIHTSYGDPMVGMSVCQSGMASGIVCNLPITSSDTYTNGVGPFFVASDGVYAGGQGDSGGPVYRYDAVNHAIPVGILSKGTSDAGFCLGLTSAARKCGKSIAFTGAGRAKSLLGFASYR